MRRTVTTLISAAVCLSAGSVVASGQGPTHRKPAESTGLGAACAAFTAPQQRAEKRLRSVEARVLGSVHGREHARSRLDDRRQACRGPVPSRHRAPRALATGLPSEVGRWSEGTLIPGVAVHSIVMPTGKLLFIYHDSVAIVGRAYVYDPVARTGRRVDPPADIFCAAQTVLADGRVLVVGGLGGRTLIGNNDYGLLHVYTFNPYDETWTRQPDTRQGRYYPTVTTLADGRALILSGRIENSTTLNSDVEVFTPSPEINGVGTITKVGSKDFNDYYPPAFVLPDGNVVVAGEGSDSALLNTTSWGWTDVPNPLSGHREYAPGILLPGPPSGSWKVMRLGGHQAQTAVAVTETFDASNPSAGWVAGAPMPEARRNHNTVILPDGKLLTVGGNGVGLRDTPYYEAHLYDPATDDWSPMASGVERRAYHSTAVLLPDGRVLSAGDNGGGGGGGGESDTVETFEPTYLFRGARPEITSAPTGAAWGSRFSVGTTGDVTRIVMMAAPATTHALDMNQRHVELSFTNNAGTLTVDAPPSSGVAPPGPYMLFALNAQGVPSVAKWVFVGPTAATPPAVPAPPTTPPATPPSTTTPTMPVSPTPPAVVPVTRAKPLTLKVTAPRTGLRASRVRFVIGLNRLTTAPILLQRKVGRRFVTVGRGRSATRTVLIRAKLGVLGTQTFRVRSLETGSAAVNSALITVLVVKPAAVRA